MNDISASFRPNRRTLLVAAAASSAAAAASSILPASARAETAGEDILDTNDATGLGDLVNGKQLSPRELIDISIARIERLNPQINAIAAAGFDRARTHADANIPPGAPFAGVPYLIKDLVEYPGLPTHFGSRMFQQNMSNWQSPYAASTDAAGLVVLGKSTTPEFGLIPATEPLLTGATRNPWNLDLSPGGSSGGACAAVAAGMVPFAQASDGGGSIRIPSSLCGLFGFKPSRGRQVKSRRDQRPVDVSVDHCVSRSVRDSALLLSLTEQKGPSAAYPPVGLVSNPGTKRLRIGYIQTNYFGQTPSPETAQATRRSAELCRELGHEVIETNWPFDGLEFVDRFMTLWGAGAAAIYNQHKDKAGRAPDESVLEPWTLGLAAEFAARDSSELGEVISGFERMTHEAENWFEKFDVFLGPVVHKEKLAIGELSPTRQYEELRQAITEFASYTAVQNVIGAPAMSVPLQMSNAGLPVGSHFWTRAGDDALLMSLALELEQANPWWDRRPAYPFPGGESMTK